MIDPVPTVPVVPNRTADNETEYRENVDAYHAAIPPFSVGLNTMAGQVNTTAATIDAQAEQIAANAQATEDFFDAIASGTLTDVQGVSASSVTIGYGTKNFTASTGKLWWPGQVLMALSSASSVNYMIGRVVSYDQAAGAMSLDVRVVGGSGTIASWLIQPAAGGLPEEWTLIGTLPTTSGTAWTLSPLPQTFADLKIDLAGVSHSSSSPQGLGIQFFDGSTWTSIISTTTTGISSSTLFSGNAMIFGYRHDLSLFEGIPDLPSSNLARATIQIAGGIQGIRFAWTLGATGDAGSIRVWGK